MSSRIGRCPQCGQVGQHADLPERTERRLLDVVAACDRPPSGWRVRASWCPQCLTPYLTCWPAEQVVAARLQLAGYPQDSPDLLPKEEER